MSPSPYAQPKQVENVRSPVSGPVLIPAIARLGLPIGIFGIAFLLIALSLTILFSPDRFPVRIGDKTVRLHDLESEGKSLTGQQADLLEQRQKILADSDAPILRQVKKLRSLLLPVGAAMLSIEDVRRSFSTGTTDPISLPGVTFDASKNALSLSGEVQDSSGRSMQILASFVDELRDITAFDSISEPEYVSRQLPDGRTVSPFTLTLRFHHE